MLAITHIHCNRNADLFAAKLRTFLEHAQAVASGRAEGDAFNWFLATEYQWEMEMAGAWLVDSADSRLNATEKATLRHFLQGMPEVREAISAGRQLSLNRNKALGSPEWADWLEVASLPSWNHLTIRTAILLSQLGTPAQNDAHFAAK
jgi:hypothetical protein